MAGIYIHVPFCGYACTYCDFYFTTHLNFKDSYLHALRKEIEMRADYLSGEQVETIYFGGGTPSQLSSAEISNILNAISTNFNIDEEVEVTLEANPDDLSPEICSQLADAGIHRVSMGTQSFHEKELELLGRKHSAQQARNAVRWLREVGIQSINLDLIYGIPNSTMDSWKASLDQMVELQPEHISAYCLTVEPGTRLEYQINKGRLQYPEDSLILQQFELLMDTLRRAGYEHYEISNFALPGAYSKHNTSYWQGKKYLGLGPSAHSYNGLERLANVASTPEYVKALEAGKISVEKEVLSEEDHFNETVMTRLRTQWGLDLNSIEKEFGPERVAFLKESSREHIASGHLTFEGDKLCLTRKGKFLADGIASDLFWI